MLKPSLALCMLLMATACQTINMGSNNLMLSHDSSGKILSGSKQQLISAIRSGCELTIAWGARGASQPERTIEHMAKPVWVSVRDGETVEAQLDNFLINLSVLGEPAEEHPRRERFGGTNEVVMWRAILKTDGSFDAVWYHPHTGKLVTRVPQNHPMKWFANCQPNSNAALFSERENKN